MTKALCGACLGLLGCLWFGGPVRPAAAGERLLNIGVHVQGDKPRNDNREPPLAGATVMLRNLRTGQVWRGSTNANGLCLFNSVPLGPYQITVQYKGVAGVQTTKDAVSNVYFQLPVKK